MLVLNCIDVVIKSINSSIESLEKMARGRCTRGQSQRVLFEEK